jgi:hypothetical protein
MPRLIVCPAGGEGPLKIELYQGVWLDYCLMPGKYLELRFSHDAAITDTTLQQYIEIARNCKCYAVRVITNDPYTRQRLSEEFGFIGDVFWLISPDTVWGIVNQSIWQLSPADMQETEFGVIAVLEKLTEIPVHLIPIGVLNGVAHYAYVKAPQNQQLTPLFRELFGYKLFRHGYCVEDITEYLDTPIPVETERVMETLGAAIYDGSFVFYNNSYARYAVFPEIMGAGINCPCNVDPNVKQEYSLAFSDCVIPSKYAVPENVGGVKLIRSVIEAWDSFIFGVNSDAYICVPQIGYIAKLSHPPADEPVIAPLGIVNGQPVNKLYYYKKKESL